MWAHPYSRRVSDQLPLYVIEADGGSRGNPGSAAYGVVIRNGQTGEVAFSDAKLIGYATNNVAEYQGLIAGLKAVGGLVEDAGRPGSVLVRMDSKLAVEQMSGRWKIKDAKLVALALRAREAIRGLATQGLTVEFVWVPRGQNADADALLNAALDAAL